MTPSQLHAMADRAEKLGKLLADFAADLRTAAGVQPELFPEPPAEKFDPKSVPLPFVEEEFRFAWVEFCDARAGQRKKITPRGAVGQLKRLAQYPVWVATKALFDAAANDWQGTFPEKVAPHTAQSFAQQDYARLLRNMAESAQRNGHE